MKKTLFLLVFYCLVYQLCADSTNIYRKLEDLEFRLKRVEGNELNYQIEKDLLKETYSNSYERINLIITIVLVVIGVLGYLGIKDIHSIKKEYEAELNNFKEFQAQFKAKSEEFDKNKKRLDDDLKSIIKENEEQGRRIKFIELKAKIPALLKENNLISALEFSNAALEINENDVDVLTYKGNALFRLNQLNDSLTSFRKALSINPKNGSALFNSVECLFFTKNIEEAKELIEGNITVFQDRENGRLLEFLELIELYHKADISKLLNIAKAYITIDNIDMTGKRMNWNWIDAHYFLHYQPEGELKKILQNIIWYWDGQINGRALLSRLNITFPTTAE